MKIFALLLLFSHSIVVSLSTQDHAQYMLTPQSVGQWNQDYNLFLNKFANATGACINQNVVIDFVYKVYY